MVKPSSSSGFPVGLLAVIVGTLAGLAAAGIIDAQLPLLAASVVLTLVVFLRRLELGLAAVVFAIFLNLSDVLIQYHGLPSLAKGFVPLMLLLLLLDWLRTGRRPFFPVNAIPVLGIYVLALALSFFYASDYHLVADGFTDSIKNLAIAIFLALLIYRPRNYRIALRSILAGAFFLASLATLKLVGGSTGEFGGFAQSPVTFMHETEKVVRLSGPMPDPNYFAQIMLIAVPIAFERMISERSMWLKCAAGATLALTLTAIVFTFSRGGLLTLIMLACTILFFYRPSAKILLAAAMAVIVAVALLPQGYFNRILSAAPMISSVEDQGGKPDESVRGRTGEMLVALEIFLDHPVLGVGYQNYPLYFQRYTLALDHMPRGEARPAHSLYLEIAAERGLLGLGTFGLLLVYFGRIMYTGYRTLIEAGRRADASMIAGLTMGFSGYLIAAIFLHDAYSRYFWLLCGLVIAVPGMVRGALSEMNLPPSGATTGPQPIIGEKRDK